MEQEPGNESGEELGNEIADVLRPYGDEHGFDAETLDEISSMEFSEAFETAYGYCAQAGLDPDDVLARFMEAPAES